MSQNLQNFAKFQKIQLDNLVRYDTIRYDGQISQATSEKKWDVKICRKRTAKKT